jgi:putative FmdB family regulatory protein
MPLYEYDCDRCGTFEVKQKMDDAPLTTHEACGEKVTRRISRSSFVLKGGGWYSDGYGSSAGSSCTSGRCGS